MLLKFSLYGELEFSLYGGLDYTIATTAGAKYICSEVNMER